MGARHSTEVDALLAAALPLRSPDALLRVAEAAASADADAQSVARAAADEEGFSALLLRLANSGAYRRGRPVADVATAVSRLGLRLVGTLAVSAPALQLLALAPADGHAGARRRLHEHAIRTATAARLLAPPPAAREEALAAGLLHNVGLSLVSLHAVDVFAALLELAGEGRPLAPLELDALGVTHARLGALAAERWGCPARLVEAIAGHDDERPAAPLARGVRHADLLMRAAGFGVEAPEPLPAELRAMAGPDPLAGLQALLCDESSGALEACLLAAA